MLDAIITHHIQKKILLILIKNDNVRFKDLKPKELESNIFMYHLNQLIKQGLVEKNTLGYVLTREGKLLADRSELASLKIRIQPKIITILTIKSDNGRWLLLRRKHQPFLNFVGFPSGKLHYGESLKTAPKRELFEKTEVDDIDLTLRGNIVMRFYDKQNNVINHIVGYVFSGTADPQKTPAASKQYFESFWGKESDLFSDPSFKGHKEILELLKHTPNNSLFFKEFDFSSNY